MRLVVCLTIAAALWLSGCAPLVKPNGGESPAATQPAEGAGPTASNEVGTTTAPSTAPAATASRPVEPVVSTALGDPLPAHQYADPQAQGPRVHIVEPHETLYGIARKYYKDGRQWRRIFQANRQRLSDPDQLPVGMKLIIP